MDRRYGSWGQYLEVARMVDADGTAVVGGAGAGGVYVAACIEGRLRVFEASPRLQTVLILESSFLPTLKPFSSRPSRPSRPSVGASSPLEAISRACDRYVDCPNKEAAQKVVVLRHARMNPDIRTLIWPKTITITVRLF